MSEINDLFGTLFSTPKNKLNDKHSFFLTPIEWEEQIFIKSTVIKMEKIVNKAKQLNKENFIKELATEYILLLKYFKNMEK